MSVEKFVTIKHIGIESEETIEMKKCFYVEYVRHMARFYFRSNLGTLQKFKTIADEANWKSCHNAAKQFDKNLLIAIYAPTGNIAHNVIKAAEQFDMSENAVWDIVRKFEELTARKRGLL